MLCVGWRSFHENTTNPGQLRTRAEFAPFFGDLESLEPGLVWAPEWYPDGEEFVREVFGVADYRWGGTEV